MSCNWKGMHDIYQKQGETAFNINIYEMFWSQKKIERKRD